MLTSAIAATFHYLALALGLGGIFLRGRSFRALIENSVTRERLSTLFAADGIWGIAALLWIATGLLRAFGGLEKGTEYYLHNPLFWVKMGLFGLVFLLEIYPMSVLIRWRMGVRRLGPAIANHPALLRRLLVINNAEVAIVVVIPFIASAMARGIGL